jgi:hypothetical protein
MKKGQYTLDARRLCPIRRSVVRWRCRRGGVVTHCCRRPIRRQIVGGGLPKSVMKAQCRTGTCQPHDRIEFLPNRGKVVGRGEGQGAGGRCAFPQELVRSNYSVVNDFRPLGEPVARPVGNHKGRRSHSQMLLSTEKRLFFVSVAHFKGEDKEVGGGGLTYLRKPHQPYHCP